MIEALRDVVGENHVLTGLDMAPYTTDWTGKYHSEPLCVIRPASTAEVAQAVKIAGKAGIAIVPRGGNTGLTGGGQAKDEIILSLERMNKIRAVKPGPRLAIVEAGAILQDIHEAADAHDLIFPLTFGARGSARIGGCLSTNAGGSNVVRYGSTRGLCLGVEVVLASGEVLNLMSEVHKDNSGYALKDLFIGAEGTLGIITAAVLKLHPKPETYATAQVGVASLDAALDLLGRLQKTSGGAVEAFEYMPRSYMHRLAHHRSDLRAPLAGDHNINLMIELGGGLVVSDILEAELALGLENGTIEDAVIAQSEGQRKEIWACREAAAEIMFDSAQLVSTDIALPLDKIGTFFDTIRPRLNALQDGMEDATVAHLGDGNLHFNVYPVESSPALLAGIQAEIDAVTAELGGSVSAEHGVGKSKLPTLATHKDPVALQVMGALKAALDPEGVLNPGKVVPG